METNITSLLDRIEEERGITIISARNIGSRAWGLDDAESDHDLGIIFTESYDPNAISTRTDTIQLGEYETDLIEFKAWSLRHFAEMIRSSNPSTLLYASSPIRHCEEPDAFEEICEYALAEFNPADAIGAHRGKAKSNFWKYLLPTLKEKGETKNREFNAIEYEPAHDTDDGMLTLEPLDNPDAETKTIHATHIGSNNWQLIHEQEERHTWRIIEPEYDDPAELETADEITARHPDNGDEISLDPSNIEPADTDSDDWEFRWGTNDRTKKRYLYIGEALMRADIIACTQEFAPARFDTLLDAYTNLPEEEQYTDLPTDTLAEYADAKRNGDGYSYTPIPGQDSIEAAIDGLLEAFQNPDNHRGGPDADELNEFIRRI